MTKENNAHDGSKLLIEDFPRGGDPILSHIERKTLAAKASADLDHELEQQKVRPVKSTPKPAKQRGDATTAPKDSFPLPFHRKIAALQRTVETKLHQSRPVPLSFSKLSVGARVLATVRRIIRMPLLSKPDANTNACLDPTLVLLGLPGGLLAHVKRSGLLEEMENGGSVRSMLPALQVGSIVQAHIVDLQSSSIASKQSITCSLLPAALHHDLGIQHAYIGLELSGWIKSLEDHGMMIDLQTDSPLRGFLRLETSGGTRPKADWAVGQWLPRLIVTSINTAHALVTLALPEAAEPSQIPNVEQWSDANLLPGLIVQAQIKRVVPGKGCFCSILDSLSGLGSGFDAILVSAKVTKEDYIVGNHMTTRILYVDPDSHMIYLMKTEPPYPWQLEAHVLSQDGSKEALLLVKPGQKVTGQVIHLDVYGALVEFAPQPLVAESKKNRPVLKALCPVAHWNESSAPNPAECPFEVGQKKTFKVLMVNEGSNRILLTRKKTLMVSELPIIASMSDAKVGEWADGYVIKVKSGPHSGALVSFYNDIKGFLPDSEIESPLRVGQGIRVRIDHLAVEKNVIRLSMKPPAAPAKQVACADALQTGTNADLEALAKNSTLAALTSLGLEMGSKTKVVIRSIKEQQIYVHLASISTVLGRLTRPQPSEAFKKGDVLLARIVGLKHARTHRYLPISHLGNDTGRYLIEFELVGENEQQEEETEGPREDDSMAVEAATEPEVGSIHSRWIVYRLLPGVGVMLVARGHLSKQAKTGRLHFCDVSYRPTQEATAEPSELEMEAGLKAISEPFTLFRIGQSLDELTVLSIEPDGRLNFGWTKYLHPKVLAKSPFLAAHPERVLGVIHHTNDKAGVFVNLSRNQIARVRISETCPTFNRAWRTLVPQPGCRVWGWILKDPNQAADDMRIEMSFIGSRKKKKGVEKNQSCLASQSLRELYGSAENLTTEKRPFSELNQGSTASVDVDTKKKRLDPLSRIMEIDDQDSIPNIKEIVDDDEEASEAESKGESEPESELALALEKRNSFEQQGESEKSLETRIESDSEAESQSSDSSELSLSTPKKRPLKKAARLADEKSVSLIEKGLTSSLESRPTEASDPIVFEQQILATPSSSLVWIQYMAYMLSYGRLESARQIAKKALVAMPYRTAEHERMNIWRAWLRLEWHAFTSSKDSSPSLENFEATLREALVRAEPKTIHLAVWDMISSSLSSAGLNPAARKKAEARLDEMATAFQVKYKGSVAVWLAIWKHYLGTNKERANALHLTATKSLPKRKLLKWKSRSALIEYANGSKERARSLSEALVTEFPRRFDLWLQFVQAEMKCATTTSATNGSARAKSFDYTRRLLERAISLSHWSSKKMKTLFKSWLAFEKKVGTEATIARVQQKAIEYVQKMTAAATIS